MQWVALLRGINVGGKNKVPMKELRQALSAAGFHNVHSYIASGNLVFASGRSTGSDESSPTASIPSQDAGVDSAVEEKPNTAPSEDYRPPGSAASIARSVEDVLEETFSIETRVLVLSRESFLEIAAAVPRDWTNDKVQKSDVLFLFPEDDSPAILNAIPPREGVDDARYIPGAVLWNVSREAQGKTGLKKILGTPLYQHVTIRNVNSVRKIAEMLG